MDDRALLDADRAFALSQVPPLRREAVAALWRLDAALGNVIAGGREPMISQIKLAWWREALERLDRQAPPAEPVLQDVAAHLLPAGASGLALAEMESAWSVLLSREALSDAELEDYARRGRQVFRLTAQVLGGSLTAAHERLGEGWALVDLARHSNRRDAEAALAAAERKLAGRVRWPAELRPLGMLATLARRDIDRGLDRLEPPGTPPRIARMLRHRLTGK
jgi:phytoene synthase